MDPVVGNPNPTSSVSSPSSRFSNPTTGMLPPSCMKVGFFPNPTSIASAANCVGLPSIGTSTGGDVPNHCTAAFTLAGSRVATALSNAARILAGS